jgi:hypothetical protein
MVANQVKLFKNCCICNALDAKEVGNVNSDVRVQAVNARNVGFVKRVRLRKTVGMLNKVRLLKRNKIYDFEMMETNSIGIITCFQIFSLFDMF